MSIGKKIDNKLQGLISFFKKGEFYESSVIWKQNPSWQD